MQVVQVSLDEKRGGGMINKLDELLQFHQAALNLRSARQELLASNVANADTPGYKARDVDFASALRNALAGSSEELPVVRTAEAHLAGNTGETIMGSPVMYRRPLQPSADGNTVDMDVERTRFADNALRYEASVMFVNSKLKGMLTAIQG
jgi:flagellar basal-body rod protein FlgB